MTDTREPHPSVGERLQQIERDVSANPGPIVRDRPAVIGRAKGPDPLPESTCDHSATERQGEVIACADCFTIVREVREQ